MALIDTTNRSAFLYSANFIPQIESICAPLKSLNIKNFCYIKIFKDSTYIQLGNGFKEWQKDFFKRIGTVKKVFEESIKTYAQKERYSYFIWPSKILDDPILSLAYEHNMWHGLTIYYKTTDCIESFSFSFDRNNDDQTNFFLNKIDLLNMFCENFKSNAKDLIDCSDKNKLALFKKGLNPEIFVSQPSSEKKEFLKNIDLNTNILTNTPQLIKFSNQENNCIKFLAQGRTMKEIGRILELPPRTVESYIDNVKNKTGLNYKSQIIDLFINTQPAHLHG